MLCQITWNRFFLMRTKVTIVTYFLTVTAVVWSEVIARTLWAFYQIHKVACCACVGNAGNVFPHRRLQRKPLVSDPGMQHGTCVTHVPWCMSGSLTRGSGEYVTGIPGACAPACLRIWQEAHWETYCSSAYIQGVVHLRYSLKTMQKTAKPLSIILCLCLHVRPC